MSLSDRWSFFRTVKSQEENQEEKESQQCNDDEVVVSMTHTHTTVSVDGQEGLQEEQQQQQTVDANVDTNVDANTEDIINTYLHETCLSQARLAEEARWKQEEEAQQARVQMVHRVHTYPDSFDYTQARLAEEARWQKEWQKQEQQQQQEQQQASREYTSNNADARNSHYKGLFTETMPTMPVLFIEEYVPPADFKKVGKKKLHALTDWRVYVYYDSYKNVYVLNGTRRRSNESGKEYTHPDIHMSFRSKSALAFYLRRSMCSWRHNLSVTMYSMYRSVIHLSTPGATPSFHSIHKCRSKFRSELFGYDDCRMSTNEFESYLKMLKESGDDGLLFRPTNC